MPQQDPGLLATRGGRSAREDQRIVNEADLFFEPKDQIEETLNDIDKSFAVPAGKQWRLYSIMVDLTSSAVAGNRQIVVDIENASSAIRARFAAAVEQAASLTHIYAFGPGVTSLTTVVGTYVGVALPSGLIVLPLYVVRVREINTVDAAADDMLVRILYGERADPLLPTA